MPQPTDLTVSVQFLTHETLLAYKTTVHRWGHRQACRFIEFCLLGITPPPLCTYLDIMIDGNHRVNALKDFVNGTFALTGLPFFPAYEGALFTALPAIVQAQLRTQTVPVNMLQSTSTLTAVALFVQRFHTQDNNQRPDASTS
jgi:hypothetical protein